MVYKAAAGSGKYRPKVERPQPTHNLKQIRKNWQRLKDEIQDTECGGETWDYLAEDIDPETGTAQHALWSGCRKIVELCLEINEQINMAYPHPIHVTPSVSEPVPNMKCHTCGGVVEVPMCINCYANNIENTKEQGASEERERVLGKLILLEDRLQKRINCTESDDKIKSLLFTIADLYLAFPELKSLRSERE